MDAAPNKPEWAMSKGDKKRAERLASGKRRRRWPIILVLVLVAGGGYAAWQAQAPSEARETEAVAAAEPVETVMRLARVDVTTLQPQTLSQRIKVTGTLNPLRRASLTAQVSGVAEAVNFRPGEQVKAGDVLVQLDIGDLQISVNQARANMAATQAQLDLAERQLASAEALSARGLTTNSSLETAQSTVVSSRAQLGALEAQVESAEAAIGKATIRAPFGGMVSSRGVEPNQSIAAGTELMSLVDLSRMEVQATAPLAQATKIAPGQVVELTAESDAGHLLSGTVDRVNPIAIEGTRSISIFATLDNADGFLKGGMFVTGDVIVARKDDALAVPAAAIQEEDGERYVLKIAGGEVFKQAVELGDVWDRQGTTEILSGLQAGDTIVNTTLERLLPGSKVAVAEAN